MQGKRFHGIDLHKRYATINVRDSDGKEIQFITRCSEFQLYINTLDENDSVVLESINNAFFWADQIEKQGASCIIVNPHKFKIIKESWNKTDKRDAANLSLGLWMSELQHEFKLPVVYKPAEEIRELRKLFSLYQMVTDQSRQHKNTMQAIFVENGIALDKKQTYQLFKPDGDVSILEQYDIEGAAKFSILTSLSIMWSILLQKENIKNEILKMGRFFKKEIKVCISIKGITPFLVLAFLADAGDVRRFKNVRGFNAYLGVVPTVKSSGGKTQMGHITRQSRKLARTLFTQPLHHIINSSDFMSEFYNNVKDRRGTGRSRIAVIRKVFNIMRCMILSGEVYRGVEKDNYEKKIMEFDKILEMAA
jgi:transposase